jgi:glycosyltransferase involved in cell wall biosynthesis
LSAEVSPGRKSRPLVSIIVPARNAAGYLTRSLPAIRAGSFTDFELILVDDHSTDETAAIARRFCDAVLANNSTPGQGTARNLGAEHATGTLLLFLDSDVCVHPDTCALLAEAFAKDAEIAAVFGSYDDEPAEPSIISSFKNLFHHYVHQTAAADATTFWTGCGALRSEVFRRLGGFRDPAFTMLEDVDYGHRLRDAGYRILLRPDVQVTHLKRWTLKSLLYTDIMRRGIPWTLMMLRRGKAERDLNFTLLQKWATVAACLLWPLLIAAMLLNDTPRFAILGAAGGLLVFLIVANAGLFRLFLAKRGWLFSAACVPLLLLYYWYSALSFVAGVILHLCGLNRAGRLSRHATP